MQPKKMLLLGKGENSIYEIMQELNANYPELKKVPIIADVRDRERIKGIMDCFEPQVVFHAAAHKHVPLMEYQPIEAVKNNVLGTKTLAEEAAAHNVETREGTASRAVWKKPQGLREYRSDVPD